MINDISNTPVVYFVAPEEKDAFVADKVSNGCTIGIITWVAESSIFQIPVTYRGHDLAD